MKGANTITLNLATVLEAMQLWLDDKFKDPPRAIHFDKTGDYSASFELKVEEKKVGDPPERPTLV